MTEIDTVLHALAPLDGKPRREREWSKPASDDHAEIVRQECERDAELRARLRHERDDEPRERSWAERAADEAGKPQFGPL